MEGSDRLDAWRVSVERIGVIAGQLAQLHADLVAAVGFVLETDAWVGDGIRSPEHLLEVVAALSPVRAREVVAVARRRGEFPELLAGMAAGQISLDQAAVVAARTPAGYARHVTGFARSVTVSQLRRVLRRYVFEGQQPNPPGGPGGSGGPGEPVVPDGPAAPGVSAAGTVGGPDQQVQPDGPVVVRDGPTLSVSSWGGRWRLVFEADPLDGALVEQALREAKDALFTSGQVGATLADGLLEVASRSLGAVTSGSRRRHYQVLVHLDADGHGWIGRRGALPGHLVEKLTCGGSVRPVWLEGARPVSVGRRLRIVPERTRVLVEDRDGGCRFPGCKVSGFVENHHIRHWSRGGSTDMDQLVSLCPAHHAGHHRGEFSIAGDPSRPDGLVFRGPGGWVIGPHIPERVPAPDHPVPLGQPVRGYPLDDGWISFVPSDRYPAKAPPVDTW